MRGITLGGRTEVIALGGVGPSADPLGVEVAVHGEVVLVRAKHLAIGARNVALQQRLRFTVRVSG